MRISKRVSAVFLMLLLFVLSPMQVSAAGPIEMEKNISLTISSKKESVILVGAEFSLFQVASVDESGELTVAENFKQFHVDIRGKNDSAWRELASTLEGYVLRDAITPAASGATDADGKLVFSNTQDSLQKGLYLVLGERLTQGDFVYESEPFMVMLPGRDAESDVWVYDVVVSPKFESKEIPKDETISRKVLKVWNDQGHESQRPQEVTIQLLQDGKVFDTVKLNAENNWRYTWEKLSNASRWTVVEKEGEALNDYTVTVTQEGITFVVTNTYQEPEISEEPEETPEEPEEPEETPEAPEEPTLPQTGQLWWPVPVLLTGGLLLIVFGLLRRRDSHEK